MTLTPNNEALAALADEIDKHFGEEGWDFPRLKRIANDMRAIAALSAEPKAQAQAAESELAVLMDRNAWRAAMIGLCTGRDYDVSTPELAAEHLRERLAAPSQAQADEEVIGAACYRGNTVSFMYDRAKAYGDEIARVWDVLRKSGRATGPADKPLHEEVKAAISTPAPEARETAEPVGTLTVSKFRGHLENVDFDYYGTLPPGTYKLAVAAPALPAPAPRAPSIEPVGMREALEKLHKAGMDVVYANNQYEARVAVHWLSEALKESGSALSSTEDPLINRAIPVFTGDLVAMCNRLCYELKKHEGHNADFIKRVQRYLREHRLSSPLRDAAAGQEKTE